LQSSIQKIRLLRKNESLSRGDINDEESWKDKEKRGRKAEKRQKA